MIELRFLEKRPGGVDFFGQRYEPLRVLQYREWPKGTIPANAEPEWVDVPIVTESK